MEEYCKQGGPCSPEEDQHEANGMNVQLRHRAVRREFKGVAGR